MAENLYCDLHVHSCFSDGENTPEELIAIAKKQNLSALALTDHNTIDGIDRFIEAAKNTSVIPVPGVEISAQYLGFEVHILGLFIDKKYYNETKNFLEIINKNKEEANIILANNLNDLGYNIDFEKIKKEANCTPNRVHFAKELTRMGYVPSVKHAFETVLRKNNGCYVEPKRINAFDALDFLHSISAVSVLAHPFLNLSRKDIESFLDTAKDFFLGGIEVLYSLYDSNIQRTAENLADKYSLLKSGGSDYHGTNKPSINMGIGEGNLKIPIEYYTKLYNKSLVLKAKNT